MIAGTVLTAPMLSGLAGVRHGFFTREGGVSSGVYRSLNCGLGSDDDRAAVLENRRRIAAHLGAREIEDGVTTAFQVHSAKAEVIDRPFVAGQVPQADALVTRTPGLAVGALAADCTPILFADAEAGVVAATHAGWRGALDGIIEATVAAMEQIGARRQRIRAAVGPTIHQPNYEVGPEFEAAFVARDPAYRKFFNRTSSASRPHFDLPGFCMEKLQAAAVTEAESLGRCTYADDSLFYSYRRKTHCGDADFGRQMSAIVVV